MTINIQESDKVKILMADDLFHIMARILEREEKLDKDKEHMWVVGLAQNLHLVFVELATLGSMTSTLAEPMEIFRVALIKGVSRIILVHNHPGGSLQPSDEDKNITNRLIQVGKIVGVQVHDHLIITPRSYCSFLDIGLMDELKTSNTYVPVYRQIDQVEKEAKRIGANDHAREVAKALKRKGMGDEEIAEISKYPLEEVKKLRVKVQKK